MTILPVLFVVAGCVSMDFTVPIEGKYITASLATKDFEIIGPVRVTSVDGSKVTYSDLLQEAAKLEADYIIDVRIDMYPGKTGSGRTFTYIGKALAIRYVNISDDFDFEDDFKKDYEDAGFFRR